MLSMLELPWSLDILSMFQLIISNTLNVYLNTPRYGEHLNSIFVVCNAGMCHSNTTNIHKSVRTIAANNKNGNVSECWKPVMPFRWKVTFPHYIRICCWNAICCCCCCCFLSIRSFSSIAIVFADSCAFLFMAVPSSSLLVENYIVKMIDSPVAISITYILIVFHL